MTISDQDLERLLQALQREQRAWVAGDFVLGPHLEQANDMTLFGPFGGDASRLTPAELAPRQAAAASQFSGGTAEVEVVKTIVSGNVVVVILIERNNVHVLDRDRAQPWVLRTTSVFRLDDDTWIRLHRHADPLIRFRPGDETFRLAAD